MSGKGPGSRNYDWDNNSDNDTACNDDNIYGDNAIEVGAYNNSDNAADDDDVHDFENGNIDDDYADNDVNGDYNDGNDDDEEVNDNNDSGSNDDDHENAIENNEHNAQVQIPGLVPNQNFEQEPQPGGDPEQEPAPGAEVAAIHHPVMVVEIQEIQGKDSSQRGVSAKYSK